MIQFYCFYLQAGISADKLMLALEPEAASLYCRHLPVQIDGESSLSTFHAGQKYLVLDAGGTYVLIPLLIFGILKAILFSLRYIHDLYGTYLKVLFDREICVTHGI